MHATQWPRTGFCRAGQVSQGQPRDVTPIGSRRQGESRPRESLALPGLEFGEREALDLGLEQPVVVQFRAQVQEHGAEADGGAVHEHEFLRHGHGSPGFQGLMHLEGLTPAVLAGLDPVGHRAGAVLEDRP